ncbi:hypothetical protein STSP2_02552 [Anaerohalosphaera lusitana]|uniref:Uncharacterized protein n=1 Tax=Anaerohalosphaera lusitana TaxID=1936003 RepID=A0A1U9NN89_9BACT|nr:hypothetical protein [Anaerohalosphaera lusitana]AQT69363.1 hypothetical protein STSP2_02552 [Anaerohalosphaera lusitana]
MVTLVKIVGLLVVIDAVIILVSPGLYRQVLEFVKLHRLFYISGLLKLITGIVFFMAISAEPAPDSPLLIGLLGLTACVSGLFLFAVRNEKLSGISGWLINKPDWFLRAAGVLVGIWGGLAVYGA